MAAKQATRVRVRLSDAYTNQTIKSWVIVVRGAVSQQSAIVRARMKARQHAAYEPGDRIEVEIAKPKRRKVENPSRKAIDHKFAGALFSAGHSKTALAYLRGTLTKSTARELAMAKPRKRARR